MKRSADNPATNPSEPDPTTTCRSCERTFATARAATQHRRIVHEGRNAFGIPKTRGAGSGVTPTEDDPEAHRPVPPPPSRSGEPRAPQLLAPNPRFGEHAGSYITDCAGICPPGTKNSLLYGAAVGQFFSECEGCGALLFLPVGSLSAAKVTLGLAGLPTDDEEDGEEAELEELPEYKAGVILRNAGIDYRVVVAEGAATFEHVYFPEGEKVEVNDGARFRVEGVEGVFVGGKPPVRAEEPEESDDSEPIEGPGGVAGTAPKKKPSWAGVAGFGGSP